MNNRTTEAGLEGQKDLYPERNTFHIRSKAIKMLSCKNFSTLLDPPLMVLYEEDSEEVLNNVLPNGE